MTRSFLLLRVLVGCSFGITLLTAAEPLVTGASGAISNRAAAKQAAVREAIARVKAEGVAAAEAALIAANARQPQTSEWHFETAGSLVRMATALRQTHEPALSVLMGERALAHLDAAEHKLRTDQRAFGSAIRQLAGYINERLAGSSEQAKVHYRAALQFAPNSAAATALGRLEKGDEEVVKKRQENLGKRG